jgi:uracil phosphoribosyltransferase
MNKVRNSRDSAKERAAYQSAILILEPILATGGSICTAIDLILRQGVSENNIIIANLITSRKALEVVFGKYPSICIVTAAVDEKLNAKW